MSRLADLRDLTPHLTRTVQELIIAKDELDEDGEVKTAISLVLGVNGSEMAYLDALVTELAHRSQAYYLTQDYSELQHIFDISGIRSSAMLEAAREALGLRNEEGFANGTCDLALAFLAPYTPKIGVSLNASPARLEELPPSMRSLRCDGNIASSAPLSEGAAGEQGGSTVVTRIAHRNETAAVDSLISSAQAAEIEKATASLKVPCLCLSCF